LLETIAAKGFDSFEVPLFDPRDLDAAAVRRELDAAGLDRTVCAILPEGINPISPDPSVRARTREHLLACIETTAALGANLMAGPLYAPVGYLTGHRRTSDEWDWAVECFQSLGDALAISNVTIALEPLNRFEAFFLTTADDAARFCDTVGDRRIGAMIDTFHANVEEKNVRQALQRLGNRLKHVHASENDRGLPGTGHVDFPGIVATLRQMNYEGNLTIESFGYTHPALARATAIWRDLAPSPEAIAFDGLRYLRSLTA
jgi:D-psicose/D-tagatose/L-ribulose 3-epimerase